MHPFWNFINERHAIYIRKDVENQPPPWTKDLILKEYKFTNIFRELDRTTIWLREHVREKYADQKDLLFFNIATFRMYGTMESGAAHGWIKTWDRERIIKADMARIADGNKVFTGAYVITNAGQKRPKVEIVVNDFLTPLWYDKRKLYAQFRDCKSLEVAWRLLGKYPGWGGGGFMAYELISDLRWTPILDDATDIMTWANAGPGAIRGLNRYHGRPVNRRETLQIPKAQSVEEMRHLLAISPKYLGSHVPKLEMREVEHTLCEFDKYMRVKNGEGRPRSKYNYETWYSIRGRN
jgi:hypothetical protein